MNGQRGHTLVELMIGTTVIAVLFATLASVGRSLHEADRTAATYADDLSQCRRVLQQIERDLREARGVEPHEHGLRVHLPDAIVAYDLRNGTLTRARAGNTTVLSRCLAALIATVDGRLVHVRLTLQQRAARAERRAAIDTTIYLRNGASEDEPR